MNWQEILNLPVSGPGIYQLLAIGDRYMGRQWFRYDGYGRGAIHLTWSYAAHTAAARARAQLVEIMSGL
ncbi:hypothetical protein DL89DRAFT_320985 [Linderina pennispora]|uniref:Uncharacterized protein n=1 Tax=Linderina pennispora TaxID=61395 RepID=A0A1Y1WF38_9FUNG|nr:uncharacterized protein DL89DRAFT_320985 [Linderina pennispora]ORX71774.1 hypothetical protein DL89DRAFT_320985 [Linderina pennispora]